MNKSQAHVITGGITQTTKMPCKSYSLPTIACVTGFRMAQIAGSICGACYANKGNYIKYAGTIEPAQHARLVSLSDPQWPAAMAALIGDDKFFRWHDSGDLQSIEHLELIAEVCAKTPDCKHWLPTREYGIVSAFVAQQDLPKNLVIRLSAMFTDKSVTVPATLRNVPGVTVSNVHKTAAPVGHSCPAYTRQGKCADCRACWDRKTVVSHPLH